VRGHARPVRSHQTPRMRPVPPLLRVRRDPRIGHAEPPGAQGACRRPHRRGYEIMATDRAVQRATVRGGRGSIRGDTVGSQEDDLSAAGPGPDRASNPVLPGAVRSACGVKMGAGPVAYPRHLPFPPPSSNLETDSEYPKRRRRPKLVGPGCESLTLGGNVGTFRRSGAPLRKRGAGEVRAGPAPRAEPDRI
jgi:hypothetical protein